MTNAEIQERKQEVKRQNGFREEREEKKIARQIELNFTQNVLKLAPSSLNPHLPLFTYVTLGKLFNLSETKFPHLLSGYHGVAMVAQYLV